MTPKQSRDTSVRHQVFLERLKTGKVNEFNKALGALDKEISKCFGKFQDRNKLSDLNLSELKNLKAELESAQGAVFSKAVDSLLESFPDLATYEAEFEARALKDVITKGKRRVKTPPAQKAYNQALKRPVQATGDLLEPLVKNFQKTAIKRINDAVLVAYGQGLTVPQTLKKLLGTGPLRFKDGMVAVSKRHAATVVRTAIQHVASTARQVTWEQNKDIVVGVEWVSTLDGHTTTQCRSLDHKKFKLDEGPRPPIHPNCRSTTAPDMDPEFDFLDKGATRSSQDGYVDANLSYYDWLKDQHESFQDEVLGETRAKLFRDGGLSAQAFADLQLDKNWDPITLDEMRKLEPLAFKRAGL